MFARHWLRQAPPRHDMAAAGAVRVVIELRAFDKGGLEKVVLDTASRFDRARVAPVVVSAGPVGPLGRQARAAGVTVIGLPGRGALACYAELLDAWRPALAVTHFSSLGLDLFAARRIPVISVIHNVYAFLDESARASFAREDGTVARYISVSAKATRYATRRLGIPPDKVETIPNGIDVAAMLRLRADTRPADRARLGIAPGDYVFLNVANYNLHKGHHLMASALRLLLRRRRDIRVVCVGDTVVPAHLASLRERLAREGLDRHMLMPGYRDDVPALLAMADAFLLPSFIEGWSIAMNEAMAFGKPLLLTDTGGAAEVIENEDIGILLPNEYGDVTALDHELLDRLAYHTREFRVAEALAAAMERFARDRARWAAAGALGLDKLRRRYDLADAVRRHEAVVLAVAGRPAP